MQHDTKLAGEIVVKARGLRYKMIVRDRDMNPVSESEWCKNLLTGVGLDYMLGATSSDVVFLHCVVGAGNAAPSISDTTLASYLGKYSAAQALSVDRQYVSSPYSLKYTTTHRFWPGALGSSPVNVAEVGMVFSSSSSAAAINASTQIGSRALVVDGLGAPTTVPYDPAEQYLDVVGEWEWVIESSVTGVVSLDINGVPTDHDYEVRPAFIGSSMGSSIGAPDFGWNDGYLSQGSEPSTQGSISVRRPWPSLGFSHVPSGSTWASSGVLQSGTQGISGTYSPPLRPNTFDFSSYTNGSYQRDMTAFWGMTNGNDGGISAVQLAMNFGAWQISYDPPIAKDATRNLTLTFRISMANA